MIEFGLSHDIVCVYLSIVVLTLACTFVITNVTGQFLCKQKYKIAIQKHCEGIDKQRVENCNYFVFEEEGHLHSFPFTLVICLHMWFLPLSQL